MYSQVSIIKTENNCFRLTIEDAFIGEFPSFDVALKELLARSDYFPPSFSLSSFLLYPSLKMEFEELEECLDKIDFLYKRTIEENKFLIEEVERLKKEKGEEDTN